MVRLLLLFCACLFARSISAAEIQFFPEHPIEGDTVHFVVDAELPTDAIYKWRYLKRGPGEFQEHTEMTRSLELPLRSAGDWLVEATATYRNARDKDVARAFRVTVSVDSAPRPLAELTGANAKPTPLTSGEKRKLTSAEKAQKAKQKASELATDAQQALEKAKQSGNAKDFSDAAEAAKAASAAHNQAAEKLKAKDIADVDTFGIRDTIVSLLTTRQNQSPGNTDSEFFKNAAAASAIFADAINAAKHEIQDKGDTLEKRNAIFILLAEKLVQGKDKAFSTSSLRDQVWRKFFENALIVIENTYKRPANRKRMETPSNLVSLYEEVQLAIDEAIEAEHEFTANYETVQNYKNSNSANDRVRSGKRIRNCLLGL